MAEAKEVAFENGGAILTGFTSNTKVGIPFNGSALGTPIDPVEARERQESAEAALRAEVAASEARRQAQTEAEYHAKVEMIQKLQAADFTDEQIQLLVGLDVWERYQKESEQ